MIKNHPKRFAYSHAYRIWYRRRYGTKRYFTDWYDDSCPASAIERYDVENVPDRAYKDLVNEEMIYIRKHEKAIIKNAKVLYSKRKSGEKNRVVELGETY